MKKTIFVYIEALFAVIVWGGTFVATKIALREVSPATIVWMRFGIGALILGALVIARKQFALPQKNEWAYLILLGFLGITFHQWLQATGLQTAKATTTAWIVATIPVFIAILSWSVLKEKLRWMQIGGIALAALGVLVIVSGGNVSALFTGTEGTFGDLLILISSVNWAVYTILSRRELGRHPAARMMFYVMSLGWLLSNIWLFGFGPGLSEIPNLTTSGWEAILILGVFGSGLAYVAYYDALLVIPAAQLGVFINIEPLVTAVLAALMINEELTPISLAGGAVVIFGVWLVNHK
jgi:drug/metabolite transporter (DMT)-like permease